MFLRTRVNLMESAVNRRQPERAEHLRTGLEGERVAFFWLMRRGYVVVARAWHSSRAPTPTPSATPSVFTCDSARNSQLRFLAR